VRLGKSRFGYGSALGEGISRDPLAGSPPFLGIDPSRLKPNKRIGELMVGPNLYEYVSNNPIDETDPTGLWGVSICMLIDNSDDPIAVWGHTCTYACTPLSNAWHAYRTGDVPPYTYATTYTVNAAKCVPCLKYLLHLDF
jgi:hypothetical protein